LIREQFLSRKVSTMTDARPSVFEVAGGQAAFLKLASALNERCLEDPVLNHPFSHPGHPQHVEHLAAYFAEVFGGPTNYSDTLGGHSAMLSIHANSGADDDLAPRFASCFVVAMDDAGLPNDPQLRRVMSDYITWATSEVHTYSPRGSVVPTNHSFPHWSWDGLVTPST
jgi:hemoglobin